MAKRGPVILDEPLSRYASSTSERSTPKRSSRTNPKLRNDYGEDFAEFSEDAYEENPQSQRGLKLKLRTRIPRSLAGQIGTGMALLLILGIGIALLAVTRAFLLHDERFIIQSPASVEIQGNQHITRSQLLDIFGEDIERNIFRVSLVERQEQLEQLSWVQHATVMRLLPNRIRISIVERIPIAFVRQGTHIGLVDADGMLLEMATKSPSNTNSQYPFPVVTGLSSTDPASTRAARMKIFQRFIADLDSSGEKVSEVLGEVDLSDPEDIKAFIPSNSSEILVHFGDDHFLERYREFKKHMAGWHAQYPNLRSVDMRYEREAVLDVANPASVQDDAIPAPPAPQKAASLTPSKSVAPAKLKTAIVHRNPAHSPAKLSSKVLAKTKLKIAVKRTTHKPAARAAKPRQVHRDVSLALPEVHAVVAPVSRRTISTQIDHKATPSVRAARRSDFLVKPSAGKPLLPTTQPIDR